MPDISGLGTLQTTEPLDLPQYKQTQEFRLPRKGRYILRSPESFPATAFGATREGYLSAQIDPTIVGPTNEGFKVRFTYLSAKQYRQSGQMVSQIGLYLKACGINSRVEGTPQEQADAIEKTAGSTFRADLDWVAENRATGFKLRGMENFPKLESGDYQSWVEDPNEKNEDGTSKRLRANLVVSRYVAADNK